MAERRRREQEEQRTRQRLALKARENLDQVVAVLRQRFCVERIVLFGSLAQGELFPDSDVDLAVEGLAAEQYFAAIDAAATLLALPVDLVRLEEAPPSLIRRIEREGESLYG